MRICLCTMLILLSLGGSVSDDELARSGKIRENAPVKASLEITIHAPVEKVWTLLTGVANWPKWQPDISAARIDGRLESGTGFSWTIGGTRIKSRVALVQPDEQFAWTGTAYWAKAIHVWKLQRLSSDQTRVTTSESVSGFLLTVFYSSTKLQQDDQRWLDRLKLAAERPFRAGQSSDPAFAEWPPFASRLEGAPSFRDLCERVGFSIA